MLTTLYQVFGVQVRVTGLEEVLEARYADPESGFAKRMAKELAETGIAQRNLGGRGKCPGGFSNNLYFQVVKISGDRYASRTVAGPTWPKWSWVDEVKKLEAKRNET